MIVVIKQHVSYIRYLGVILKKIPFYSIKEIRFLSDR